jgi:hypothetical protein
MSLQDITITGSIGSIASQSYGQRTYISSTDEQSFPIEHITGSDAKVWPNFSPGTNYTVDLIVNVTQSWSASNVTPLGIVPYTHDTMEEFINGEFSGSNYVVSDGNLTDEDCQQFLEVNTTPTSYSMFPYSIYRINGVVQFDNFDEFIHRYTAPRNGEFLMFYESDDISSTNYIKITYLKIARVDQQGTDNTLSLQELTSIRWTDSEPTVGEIILTILNITEYPDYYLYAVSSKTWIDIPYFADDNVLNYSLHATSSANSLITGQYAYLTSSWLALVDSASGFSNGQYEFPLTPNCTIQFTASIGLTLSTPATFSWAINGYDDILNPHNISNAVASIYAPIGTTNYNLGVGSHTLIISSSTYQPIQSYLFEIDALLLNTEELLNSELIGTGSAQNTGQLPVGWRCTETGSAPPDIDNTWLSLTSPDLGSGYPTSIPGHPGGVIYLGFNDCILRQDTFGITNYFTTGQTYYINITIPEPLTLPNNGTNIPGTYGPSLYPLTCSLSKANPTASANIIGYIPSGAYGTFTFTRTAIAADQEVCIVTNNSSSQINYPSNGFDHYLIIAEISAAITSSATINNLSLRITSSQPPQTSTSSVVLEPYLTSTFRNSDCDVLMNNYSQNDINTTYQEVLYDGGGTIPSNLQQIISGTAQYAEVNDYLYNANASVLPRYKGVRSTSPNFNLNSTEGGYSTLPNVESTQTYFAYYDYITSSYAELLNNSLVHILYLIDEQGNVFTPSLSSSYYYNLIDNFETNKNTNVTTTNDSNISLGGLRPILRPGAVPWGICASQTGSGNNFNTTMSFSNTTSTTLVPNYASLVNSQSPYQQFLRGTSQLFGFVSLVYQGAQTTHSFSGNFYKILSTANNVTLNLKLEGTFGLSLQANNPPSGIVNLTAYCQRSENSTTWSNIDSKTISITYGTPTYVNTNFKSFIPTSGSYFRVLIYNGSGYFTSEMTNGKISLVQTPIPTDAGIITSSYWITGSNSKNILTGSQFLQLYTSYKTYQLNYVDSGYKNFLEFDIRPADEIRFEGDESQVYSIYNVTTSTSSLYLELDRNIVDGTNLNSFLIRRYEAHPNFITLNWDITDFGDSIGTPGFIFPEYPSNTLKENLPKIIEDLTNKSLI